MFSKCLLFSVALFWTGTAAAVPIVWSGYDHLFTKGDGIDPFAAGGYDEITPAISLSRLNAGGGLLNVASETTYHKPTSPAGTQWAFSYANPNRVVAAWNYAELIFLPWADAFGSNSAGGPPATLGQPSVVHLLTEDIYLDLRLTAWTVRTGGGFAYERASGPSIAGDYDGDREVDGGDFLRWQREFGSTGPRLASDGDGNDAVDGVDFDIWRDHFGMGNRVASSVPEPPWGAFVLTVSILAGTFSRRAKGKY